MTTLANAITKFLVTKMPAEVASKFEIDEAQFKEFLQEYLTSQFGKASKASKGGPKGKDGKGRITGYLMFSNANRESVRDKNPGIKFTDVGKELGDMWKKISAEERVRWNNKATAHNAANGLPTPTPSAKQEAGAKGSKASKPKSKGKAAKSEAESDELKVVRDQASKSWVVDGTQFVVQSHSSRNVVGKLRGTKVVSLTAADVKKCESMGLTATPAPAKAPRAAPKGRGKAPAADESAAGSDDNDSANE